MDLDSRLLPRIAVAFEPSPLPYYAVACWMDALTLVTLHAEMEPCTRADLQVQGYRSHSKEKKTNARLNIQAQVLSPPSVRSVC
jgi:hypothetical protein